MRLSLLAVCMAGLLSFTTSAVMASPKAAADKEGAKSVKATDKGVEKVIAGPVVSVNVEKKEIIVERKGKQYAVLLDASTKVAIGGQSVGLDMVKVGETVSINYLRFSDGSRVALNIAGSSPVPTSKKAEVKKEAGPATKAEVKAEVKKEAAPAPKAEVKAEPKAEVKKEAAPAPKAEVKAEPKAEVKKEAAPAPKAEVKAEPKAEVKKEAAPAPKAEVKAEPKAEVKKEAAPAPKAEVKAVPKAEVKKDAAPAAKAETKADSTKAAQAAQPVKVQK